MTSIYYNVEKETGIKKVTATANFTNELRNGFSSTYPRQHHDSTRRRHNQTTNKHQHY